MEMERLSDWNECCHGSCHCLRALCLQQDAFEIHGIYSLHNAYRFSLRSLPVSFLSDACACFDDRDLPRVVFHIVPQASSVHLPTPKPEPDCTVLLQNPTSPSARTSTTVTTSSSSTSSPTQILSAVHFSIRNCLQIISLVFLLLRAQSRRWDYSFPGKHLPAGHI